MLRRASDERRTTAKACALRSIIVHEALQLLRDPRRKPKRGQLLPKRPHNLHNPVLDCCSYSQAVSECYAPAAGQRTIKAAKDAPSLTTLNTSLARPASIASVSFSATSFIDSSFSLSGPGNMYFAFSSAW